MKVKLYIEGGGDGQLHDTLFRQAWRRFFEAAGLGGKLPQVVRGGGRAQTFDAFATAVRSSVGQQVSLLLVDSEGPVDADRTARRHLEARDNWQPPSGAADDQVFLMVQLMETWFLADRELLETYFGGSLRGKHLPEWPDLESVPKRTVLAALEKATAGCARRYSKGKVSYELLGRLSPKRVETACPHANALLDRLRRA